MGKTELKDITYEEADDYCLKHYGITLAEKMDRIHQDWIDKLKETIMEEKEEERWEKLS